MAKKLRKKGKDWCRAELMVVRLCSGKMRVKQIGLLMAKYKQNKAAGRA